jgi:glucosamine--fructose-6-phosphate aminotransferase (isomerizing)
MNIMCGIIGYTGPLEAKKLLIQGLAGLEYRGYDSAGVAFFNTNSQIQLIKQVGKVAALKEACQLASNDTHSHCGIGHTRWATHGGVTNANAHPHQAGSVTLIHNGIIENYHQLTEEFRLQEKLVSQTDSEVAAWVLDHYYHNDPFTAIKAMVKKLEGSYGFCIMFSNRPGEIYAIRSVSPLVAAYTHSGAVIASDLTALIPYTQNYFVVPEGEIVRLTPYKVQTYSLDTFEKTQPEQMTVNWNMDAAMKNGFPHFMLKEIHEQPEAMKQTILPRLSKGLPDFTDDAISDDAFLSCSQIHIIACGTAMHAGMVAKTIIEPLLRIPVSVTIASEFRYQQPLIDEKTLVIVISQSGETIDTLAAMRLAQSYGSKTLAIVNVKGSTIARESGWVLYTHAGPEIAVASTKAYSVQLAALYLITCRMALVRKIYTADQAREFLAEFLDVIPAMESVIQKKEEMKSVVTHIINSPDAFFIGRGLDYAFSLEGALKLKEISYIHAEAYAAGELKHGTIALISEQVPVIAIATQDNIFTKSISNVREVKARGAFVILVTKEGADIDSGLADIHITIPSVKDIFTVFPIAVVLQLIAYYASLGKNLDVDQPRNLAKSVTVE